MWKPRCAEPSQFYSTNLQSPAQRADNLTMWIKILERTLQVIALVIGVTVLAVLWGASRLPVTTPTHPYRLSPFGNAPVENLDLGPAYVPCENGGVHRDPRWQRPEPGDPRFWYTKKNGLVYEPGQPLAPYSTGDGGE